MNEVDEIEEIEGKRELAFTLENGCKLWIVKDSNMILECTEQEVEIDLGKNDIGLIAKLLDL